MASRIPESKQLEIVSGGWKPKWPWEPKYVMFTSYWPDPAYFIAYGTDGVTTFAVRGTWQKDLRKFLDLVSPLKVSFIRIPRYPTSDDVEVIPPDVELKKPEKDGPAAFLPPSVSTNPTEMGDSMSAGMPAPNSASLCITVPHWNAVARAFGRLVFS